MVSPSQSAPPPIATTASRASFRRYLLWALLLPVIAWVVAFPLVCSRNYEQWGETQYGPVLEFPYEAATPSADVVIFGDSSAFLGLDPRLIRRETGLSTVVLPSTVGSLPVIADAPLRSYLQRHPQPKLIVLYFTAWDLDFTHVAPGRLFEGEEMMLRHGTAGEILAFQGKHPLELLAFPMRLYSTFGPRMLSRILHHESRAEDTSAGLGHVPYVEPYGPLNDLCEIPRSYLDQHSDATVAALQQRYTRPGTEVLVYLAPAPRCLNSAALETQERRALGAQAPVLLPPTDFAADPYYAHILPAYVPVASHVLVQALRARLPNLVAPAP